MENIGSLFEKFKGKFAKHISNLSIATEVIKKFTGITYNIKDISISNGVLRIKSTQAEKNEIYIKQHKITQEINRKIVGTKIQEIK
jgi:hypothetical protein